MPIRPVINKHAQSASMVDTYLGTAYPIVKRVYDYLDDIAIVSQVFQEGRAKDIELQMNKVAQTVEWRYKGEDNWRLLFDFVDVIGGVSRTFTTDEKEKLADIEPYAQANVQSDWNESNNSSDAYINNKPGEASTSSSGLMSASDKAKLDTVSAGATATQTDAYLLDRANHTGTQTLSTISNAGTAATYHVGTDPNQVPRNSDLGSASKATLVLGPGNSDTAAMSQNAVTKQINLNNWQLFQNGSVLEFRYNGIAVAKLSSTGVFTAKGDVVRDTGM